MVAGPRHRRWLVASLVRRLILATTILLMASVSAADPRDITFVGRAVADVLADYRQAGFRVVYSTDLVPTSKRFFKDPASGEPIVRLSAALESLGLTLRRADDAERFLVVRADRVDDPGRLVHGTVSDRRTGQPIANAVSDETNLLASIIGNNITDCHH